MSQLCLTLVLVLDPQAASTQAVAAAASARACTRVLTLTGKAEADRASVGSVPARIPMLAYGPAAAAAAVARWPNRELTIGGIGPANAPFFAAPHRRVLAMAPGAVGALSMAVKLLPSRNTWCMPEDASMAQDRVDQARQALARRGISLIGYRDNPPAGCSGLVAWYEGPASTPAGLEKLVRAGESLRLPVLGFDPRLLAEGVDLAVGVDLAGYFSVLLKGGELASHEALHVNPNSARRKGLAWPQTWPQVPLRLVQPRRP